ncbi:MAG: family hydrolase [Segetibacter sp.]|nr:family hydrolase [Segetibacter sp.]
METKEEILELLNLYLKKYSQENEETNPLIQFLNEHEGEELINRKNFTGHITASAFIIDEDAKALLLLKHKSLNRWLQPGGHVDSTDASLVVAALREACEETGLAEEDLTLLSNNIFDVNSHHIPANMRKSEPGHVHHDIRFLFQCSNSQSLKISLEESTDSKWISFSHLFDNEDFYWVEEKTRAFT